ncbi:uncharacterized protein [Antedon mediterranea]|uniref:uncharacterized protein n=1 Tax=Antedon mediterranea TaxID=105859 RepID=UPI003AF88EE0
MSNLSCEIHTMGSEQDDTDTISELLYSAKVADVGRFKQLLNDGADVLQKDNNERTVLHWASNSGSAAIILAGVSKGLTWHINAKSKRGLTPLHEACLAGHRKCMYLLLSLGADVTIQTMQGYTTLMCAAGNGNADATRILVGAGCDGNEVIKPIGVNALHIASWTGQEEVVKLLIRLGCDPDAKSQVGKTPIEYAIEQRHTGCMEVLRNHSKTEKETVDTKVLKSKMARMKKKLVQYYEDKLQEEITYFEQQLQAQHCKDLGVIMKLTNELERVYGLLNGGSTTKLSNEHKPRIDFAKMQSPVSKRSFSRTSMTTRSSSMDMPISSRNGYYSSDGEDEELFYDEELSPESNPSSRPGTPMNRPRRDASMVELVEEASQRKDSMSNLRKQTSLESDYNSRPMTPREIVTQKGLHIPRPMAASPSLSKVHRRRHTSTPNPPNISSLARSPLTPRPPQMSSPTAPQMSLPVPQTSSRTRRKSSGLFIRRQSLLDESADDEEKTRRKSVAAVRMPTSPKTSQKEPTNTTGNILFNVPIPDLRN